MEICDDITIFRNGANVAYIDFEKDGKQSEKIIGYITGETKCPERDENGGAQRRRACTDEAFFCVHGLKYGKFLQNIDLSLKKGEILGISGLAGQGQNELMLALAGNYPQIHESAELKGKKIKLNKPSGVIRDGVLLVPGDRQLDGLFLQHSIFTNMIFPKAGLKKQPLFTPAKKYRKECEEIADALSIKMSSIDMPVGNLSGGNQQKVVVGKWMSFDINVLLLADPAKGVDVGAKRDLYQYILKLVREKDMSVILYASDNEELVDYCDRVLIMYEGQIVGSLEGDEISEDAIVTASLCAK